jgi:hypothetical protein
MHLCEQGNEHFGFIKPVSFLTTLTTISFKNKDVHLEPYENNLKTCFELSKQKLIKQKSNVSVLLQTIYRILVKVKLSL